MVGIDEIIFIGVIALLLFGPDKLPEYIREMGKLYAEFKKAQKDLEGEFNKAVTASLSEPKAPSGTVMEIARKMNIASDNKTEEQLLRDIETAVSSQSGKV